MKLDANDENKYSSGSAEEQILDDDLSKTVLQKLGKYLAEDLKDVIIGSCSPKKQQQYYSEFPTHKLGFQTLHFMYRNHLISEEDFVSLFKKEVLDEAAENMHHSNVYEDPNTFDIDQSKDCMNIFNAWYGSPAREMFSGEFFSPDNGLIILL
jgi:hypothetical protein